MSASEALTEEEALQSLQESLPQISDTTSDTMPAKPPNIITVGSSSMTHSESTPSSSRMTPSRSNKKRKYKPIPELVEQLREWMNEILDTKLKPDFWGELKSGIKLCEILNKIKPGTCQQFEESDRTYIQKRNIDIYLAGCRALGVHKNNTFKSTDLAKNYRLKSSQRLIINNFHSVIKIAKQIAKQMEIEANEIVLNDYNSTLSKSMINHNIAYSDFDFEEDSKDNNEIVSMTPCTHSNSIKRKKRKFKLAQRESMSSSVLTNHSNISSAVSEIGINDSSYIDTKCYSDKKLVLRGYFHECSNCYDVTKDSFVKKMVTLYCIGEIGVLYWALSSTDIDEMLEEEEDMLQNNQTLELDYGNVVFDVGMSHNNSVLSFTVNNANKNVNVIAYVYVKCVNNGCIVKKLFDGNENTCLDMDLMDIRAWQKQSTLEWQQTFMNLNTQKQRSARYFQIPFLDTQLEFMFYCELLSVCSNANMNKQIEYKWDNKNIEINGLFKDMQIFSDSFGDESIEYDKCWSLYAKYSEINDHFCIGLALWKLPIKIGEIKVICMLNVEGEQFNKSVKMGLKHNICEWENVRIETQILNEKKVNISIGIVEVYDKEQNLVPKSDWKFCGIT